MRRRKDGPRPANIRGIDRQHRLEIRRRGGPLAEACPHLGASEVQAGVGVEFPISRVSGERASLHRRSGSAARRGPARGGPGRRHPTGRSELDRPRLVGLRRPAGSPSRWRTRSAEQQRPVIGAGGEQSIEMPERGREGPNCSQWAAVRSCRASGSSGMRGRVRRRIASRRLHSSGVSLTWSPVPVGPEPDCRGPGPPADPDRSGEKTGTGQRTVLSPAVTSEDPGVNAERLAAIAPEPGDPGRDGEMRARPACSSPRPRTGSVRPWSRWPRAAPSGAERHADDGPVVPHRRAGRSPVAGPTGEPSSRAPVSRVLPSGLRANARTDRRTGGRFLGGVAIDGMDPIGGQDKQASAPRLE